jgi:hypothetical protein
MIASHDSYTFLPPRRWWMRLFTWMWRTQDRNIVEQKKAGARYLDIRVRRNTRRGRKCRWGQLWRVCHGLVDLDMTFASLLEIDALMASHGFRYRLILERGDIHDRALFSDQLLKIAMSHSAVGDENQELLRFAAVKRNWEVILDMKDSIVDNSFTPFLSSNTLWQNIKRMWSFRTLSPRKWKMKHPTLIDDFVEESSTVFFYDFV